VAGVGVGAGAGVELFARAEPTTGAAITAAVDGCTTTACTSSADTVGRSGAGSAAGGTGSDCITLKYDVGSWNFVFVNAFVHTSKSDVAPVLVWMLKEGCCIQGCARRTKGTPRKQRSERERELPYSTPTNHPPFAKRIH